MDAQSGKWYLFVYCQSEACGMSWACLEVPGPPAPLDVPDPLELTCPHCGYSSVYDPKDVVRGHIK